MNPEVTLTTSPASTAASAPLISTACGRRETSSWIAETRGDVTASLSALHSSCAPSCCLPTVRASSLRPVPVLSASSLELARPGTCCPLMYQLT